MSVVAVSLEVYASSDANKAPLCKTYPLDGTFKILKKAERGTRSRLQPEDLERLQALFLETSRKRKSHLEIAYLERLVDVVHAARRYEDIMRSGKNKAHKHFVTRIQLVIA